MVQPVGQQERLELVEVAVVEDQQELAAILAQALNRVRYAAREQPEISFVHVFHERPALLIDCRDARAAGRHIGPLGAHMPVQFADAAGDQTHLHASHLLRQREVAHRHLASPAARLDAFVRHGKGILERRLAARIGLRRVHRIRLLRLQAGVLRPQLLLVDAGMRIPAQVLRLLRRCQNRKARRRYQSGRGLSLKTIAG